MKNYKLIIVGTFVLFVALVLNFKHALDDYGIVKNNLHHAVLAQSSSGWIDGTFIPGSSGGGNGLNELGCKSCGVLTNCKCNVSNGVNPCEQKCQTGGCGASSCSLDNDRGYPVMITASNVNAFACCYKVGPTVSAVEIPRTCCGSK